LEREERDMARSFSIDASQEGRWQSEWMHRGEVAMVIKYKRAWGKGGKGIGKKRERYGLPL
jgi:hypothetical protein